MALVCFYNKSTKTSIVLILIITFTSIISTFIPQNREPAFYTDVLSRSVVGNMAVHLVADDIATVPDVALP